LGCDVLQLAGDRHPLVFVKRGCDCSRRCRKSFAGGHPWRRCLRHDRPRTHE
jgi:hypothetical protein